jgi:phosphopantothenate synthetase
MIFISLKCENQNQINDIIRKLMFLNEVKEISGGLDKKMTINFNGIYEEREIRFLGFSRINGSIILGTDENFKIQDFFSRSFIIDNRIINAKVKLINLEDNLSIING